MRKAVDRVKVSPFARCVSRWGVTIVLMVAAGFVPLTLDKMWPRPPVVEFLGAAGHAKIVQGDRIPIRFDDVLRNEFCGVIIVVRWKHVAGNGLPGALLAGRGSVSFVATPADMTGEPVPFAAELPAHLAPPPGEWFYAPLAFPGNDCESDANIVIPPHRVSVEEAPDGGK